MVYCFSQEVSVRVFRRLLMMLAVAFAVLGGVAGSHICWAG